MDTRRQIPEVVECRQHNRTAPTAATVANINELRAAIPGLTAKWKALQSTELAALNSKLRAAGLAEIKVEEKPLSRIIGVDMDVRRGQVAGEE